MQEELGYGRPPASFDPRISQLFDYWETKRAGRPVPDRSDIDPIIDIPKLASALWLLDVENDPVRFRYRLIGQDLVAAGVVSRTGDYVDEQPRTGAGDDLGPAFLKSLKDKTPFWRRGSPRLVHDRHITALQNLILPLSHGEDRQMLLNMTIYEWRETPS